MSGEDKKPDEKKPEEKKIDLKDNIVETKHSLVIGGKEIKYTATTGTLVMREETADREKESEGEKPKAAFFFVAYTKDDVLDKTKRPLTFSYNGGPGSSSVWLHLGLLGPRRVMMGDAGNLLPPPYGIGDNEFSLLDQTDLVFHRPCQHRVFASGGRPESKRFPRIQERHRKRGGFHPSVYHPLWTLVFSQIPGGRKLRHNTFRWTIRVSAGTPRPVPERYHAHLSSAGFQHAGI